MSPVRVSFFPSVEHLSENPYWPSLASSLESLGVTVDLSGPASFGRRWLWANRGQIQVLHLHFVQQFYAYEVTGARLRWVLRLARSLLLARVLGYRTVFTLHDLEPTFALQPVWVDYLGHWMTANLTNAVIVHCDRARGLLAERFGRRREVYVVPHPNFIGIYPNTIPPDEARRRLGLAPHDTVFLFFGGMRPNKGIEQLISAFGHLPGKDLRLVIAGKTWPPMEYTEGLLDMARRDHRIHIFPKFIATEEVQLFLNAADAVVLPFKQILTSSSAILAMSFGKPVVASAMGCLPELVTEDSGILYSPDGPDALLNALRRCTQADLRAMGERSLRRAQGFDAEAIAARTLAAYGYDKCPLPAASAVGPTSNHVGRAQ